MVEKTVTQIWDSMCDNTHVITNKQWFTKHTCISFV
jgi:hypothetical protein